MHFESIQQSLCRWRCRLVGNHWEIVIPLRPYQRECVDAVLDTLKDEPSCYVEIPTGGGKTVVFSHVIEELRHKFFEKKRSIKALVMVHRKELMAQAANTLMSTGLPIGMDGCGSRADDSCQVVVSTVQTAARKLDYYHSHQWPIVIWDECHHTASESWLTIYNHFSASKQIGFSATPYRADGKDLPFGTCAYRITMKSLTKLGFLSPITVIRPQIDLNIDSVKMKHGDFDQRAAATALTPFMPSIAAEIKRLAPFRKILVFVPLISTSVDFVDACKSVGFVAEHVDGEMDDREGALKRLKNGETDLVCNSSLLIEGFDDAQIDCVIPLRPTSSAGLYAQMIGRGTRIAPHKTDCLIIDPLWQHKKHRVKNASCINYDGSSGNEWDIESEQVFGKEAISLEEAMRVAAMRKADSEESLLQKLRTAGLDGKAKTLDEIPTPRQKWICERVVKVDPHGKTRAELGRLLAMKLKYHRYVRASNFDRYED